MAFSPPGYYRLFAQRRPTKGGSRAPQDLPPLATPLDEGKIDASGLYVLYASDFTSTLFFYKNVFPARA